MISITSYAPSQTLPLAFPKSSYEHGQPSCGVASWINPGGIIHCLYDNGHGTQWDSESQAFVCAFANNLGTWRKHANGWFHMPIPGGRILAVASQVIADQQRRIQADVACPTIFGQAVPPLPGVSSNTIQVMTGPSGFDIPADHVAHGVKQCFVDDNLNSVCTFEDGEGNVWGGAAGVFSLLCDTPNADPGGDIIPPDSTTWAGTTSAGGSGGGGGGGGSSPGGGSGNPGGGQTPLQDEVN